MSAENREHEHDPEHEHDEECACAEHGPIVRVISCGLGQPGTCYVTFHEDGVVFASVFGVGQRAVHRFDPTRDGRALRSTERGRHGERARADVERVLAAHGVQVVPSDRRGRPARGAMTAADKLAVVDGMLARVKGPRRTSVAAAADFVGQELHRTPRTVLDVWRDSSNGRLVPVPCEQCGDRGIVAGHDVAVYGPAPYLRAGGVVTITGPPTQIGTERLPDRLCECGPTCWVPRSSSPIRGASERPWRSANDIDSS